MSFEEIHVNADGRRAIGKPGFNRTLAKNPTWPRARCSPYPQVEGPAPAVSSDLGAMSEMSYLIELPSQFFLTRLLTTVEMQVKMEPGTAGCL
jgi:hypothetical protein